MSIRLHQIVQRGQGTAPLLRPRPPAPFETGGTFAGDRDMHVAPPVEQGFEQDVVEGTPATSLTAPALPATPEPSAAPPATRIPGHGLPEAVILSPPAARGSAAGANHSATPPDLEDDAPASPAGLTAPAPSAAPPQPRPPVQRPLVQGPLMQGPLVQGPHVQRRSAAPTGSAGQAADGALEQPGESLIAPAQSAELPLRTDPSRSLPAPAVPQQRETLAAPRNAPADRIEPSQTADDRAPPRFAAPHAPTPASASANTASRSAEAPPAIEIRIGRIDVTVPPAPSNPAAHLSARPATGSAGVGMSLDAFLAEVRR